MVKGLTIAALTRCSFSCMEKKCTSVFSAKGKMKEGAALTDPGGEDTSCVL